MKKMIAFVLAMCMLGGFPAYTHASGGEEIYNFTTNGSTATITGFKTVPSALTEVVIPRSVSDENGTYTVTEIGDQAFSGQNTFTDFCTVYIPGTVKTIGDQAFGVSALKGDNNTAKSGPTKIVIEEGVETIKYRAFFDTKSLVSVNIPSTVTTIGDGIFHGCYNLKDIEIGEGIHKTTDRMFRDAQANTEMILPSTVTEIDTSSFGFVRRTQNMYVLADDVTIKNRFAADGGDTDPTGKGLGSIAPDKACNIYVVNDNVKQKFIAAGYPAEYNGKAKINVLEHNAAFFYDTFDNAVMVQDEDDDGYITAPEDVRGKDGLRFLSWEINGQKYFPGDKIPLAKSVVVTGNWERDVEPASAVYVNVSSFAEDNSFDKTVVRKIVCKNLAKRTIANVKFTDSDGNETSKDLFFDVNGEWLNDCDDEYTKITMPQGNDYSELYILKEESGALSFKVMLRRPQVLVFPRINKNSDLSKMTWKSADENIAKAENGVITGVASGNTVITVSDDDMEYKFDVQVFGELDLAVENNKVSEYLAEKEPVFNALNTAIETKNYDDLKNVLDGTDANGIQNIQDIDVSLITALGADGTEKLAKRIASYGKFAFANENDVRNFISTLNSEVKLGEVLALTSADDLEAALIVNSPSWGLQLDNEYYKKNKAEVLAQLLAYEPENLAAYKEKFKETYVMISVNGAANAGYAVLQKTVTELSAEILYNAAHYAQINTADFHQKLLSAIRGGTVKTMAELKNYIDTAAVLTPTPAPGGSTGGGGGGSKTSFPTISADFSKDKYNEYNNTTLPQDTTSVFADIDTGRWSYEAVKYLYAKKVVSGYADNLFCPENEITRAEFVSILVKAFNFEGTETEESFTDVNEGDWYYASVTAALGKKIVYGDGGAFRPNDKITRQEMAAMLYRAMVASDIKLKIKRNAEPSDANHISDWAYAAVTQLVNMEVINGYEDNSFRPNDNATREQVAQVVYGIVNNDTEGESA